MRAARPGAAGERCPRPTERGRCASRGQHEDGAAGAHERGSGVPSTRADPRPVDSTAGRGPVKVKIQDLGGKSGYAHQGQRFDRRSASAPRLLPWIGRADPWPHRTRGGLASKIRRVTARPRNRAGTATGQRRCRAGHARGNGTATVSGRTRTRQRDGTGRDGTGRGQGQASETETEAEYGYGCRERRDQPAKPRVHPGYVTVAKWCTAGPANRTNTPPMARNGPNGMYL